jgi:hypothetical protein
MGVRDLVLHYICGVKVYVTLRFCYTRRVIINSFISVVPGVLFGLVVYCGRGSDVAGKTLGQMSYSRVGVSVSMPCVFIRSSTQKPRRASMTSDPASSQPHKTPCHNTRPGQRERRKQQIGMYLITPSQCIIGKPHCNIYFNPTCIL